MAILSCLCKMSEYYLYSAKTSCFWSKNVFVVRGCIGRDVLMSCGMITGNFLKMVGERLPQKN